MSLYKDYIDGSLADDKVELFGLERGNEARKHVKCQLENGGFAYKGFDFASAAGRILIGRKEPVIIHTGTKRIIRPTILNKENDTQFWTGFKEFFPVISQRLELNFYISEVPSWEEIEEATEPIILASHLPQSKALNVQTFEGALQREPALNIWDTNPNKHIIVTFEHLKTELGIPLNSPIEAGSA